MDERGLGKQLQEARQAAGLTQQQLCHDANLSFSTLTKIERGAIKAPSIFTIQAIAGALNVGLDELMGQAPPNKNRKLHKTKSGVSFIYFDVHDCLVRYYQRAFGKLAADTGIRADIIESAFWYLNDDANKGQLTMTDVNARLRERIGAEEPIDWPAYFLDAIEPIEEMQEVLKWAAGKYRIGLLTNIMPGLLKGMIANGKLPNLNYDAIVESPEVGAVKPEAQIYEIAQGLAGAPADEILLVDDNRANLTAAERAGWKALSFDDANIEESVQRVREALEPAD